MKGRTRGLGRHAYFDQRNVDYLITDGYSDDAHTALKQAGALLTRGNASGDARGLVERLDEKYHWRHDWVGDQGFTPTCTGFAATKLWVNGPITHRHQPGSNFNALANDLYTWAVGIDQREGRYFSGGATMLALAKSLKQIGLISEYRWGYTINDFIAGVLQAPVLLGIWWRSEMNDPDPKWGVVRYSGEYEGGHCILATGIDLDDGMVRLDNTWGREWGKEGHCYIPLRDLERAIAEDGEVLLVREAETVK